MSEIDLDQAIARALQAPARDGLPSLIALRDRLQGEAGPMAPGLPLIWDAILQVVRRSPDDEESMRREEERARWLGQTVGVSAPETLEAWLELGDAAEQEMEWDVAVRAWEAVLAAVAADGDVDAARPSISPALRGLGTRRLSAGRVSDAVALFERDLALNEQLFPGHPQLALSLDNLARAVERLGDSARALALRQRQRQVLQATGASAGQLAALDQHVSRLGAA